MNTTRTIGVTGTDTGIGKTIFSCALAAYARARGMRVAAMKPVETGIAARMDAGGLPLRADAERLRDAAGAEHSLDLVRPYGFVEPLAPLMASVRSGVQIDVARLDSARTALSVDCDLLIVEGAGGLLVPLTTSYTFADLFSQWQCEVVIIAGNRLGVLNHVLLTVRAAQQAGLTLRGVVLTSLSDRDGTIAEATNYDALRMLLGGIPLYRFPWVDRIDDHAALATAFEASGLDELVQPRTPAEVLHDG